MIGIVDYGMGNLLSVYNAFDYLGEDVFVCKKPEDLAKADRIVIPGVGAFKECVELLKSKHFAEALNEEVIVKAKPTLGICLGMQVMAKKSYEGGEHEGLGWFDAEVIKIDSKSDTLRVPNIGWNEVHHNEDKKLFKKIRQDMDFYLVHSYYMKCKNSENVIATYDYGGQITAAVLKDNIFATQFHPEKSQDVGLDLLINFLDWKP
jgi:glutamine amidotransferase